MNNHKQRTNNSTTNRNNRYVLSRVAQVPPRRAGRGDIAVHHGRRRYLVAGGSRLGFCCVSHIYCVVMFILYLLNYFLLPSLHLFVFKPRTRYIPPIVCIGYW